VRGNFHPHWCVEFLATVNSSIDRLWLDARGCPDHLVARIVDNAFRVLGLTPRAAWPEVRRRADALLESLATEADPTYPTPLGPRPLTEGAILVARAQLRDPDVRIQHEIWWEAPGRETPRGPETEAWPHAAAAWGWRPR